MTHAVRQLVPVFALLAATAGFCPAADRIVRLDGETFDGKVVAIAEGRVRLAGGAALDLADLRRIERRPPSAASNAPVVLHMTDGGRVLARDVGLIGETCRIQWVHGDDWEAPLGAIAALRFARSDRGEERDAPEEFRHALDDDGDGRDRLLVLSDDRTLVVRGALQEIRPTHLVFMWNDKPRTVARAKVLGVVLSTEGGRPDRTGWCLAELDDGSAVWGRDPALAKDTLALAVTGGGGLRLPWKAVTRLTIRSERMVFVSDLEPVAVVERALLTFPGPWRRDRSVLGRPLTLGGAVFEKGLGVHALCRLTYATDARYDVFAATIGIDAETQGKGDCVFVVLGDGKELFRRRMRAADPPAPVRVAIAAVRRVTLAVEPGEDLDLADHADWCDARFVKKR